jgi:mannan endo-1,6-alpha-mannosidase
MVSFYKGNESGEIPGLLPASDGYFWWEAGAMFDTLIQYWALTGDDQYNNIVSQGIQFQEGDHADFMPLNQTKSLGNDDQSIWASAAMTAVELSFPAPSADSSWLSLAENVFNDLVARWDESTCGGGLRWQIFPFNIGYDYKNSVSNGGFFQLAARLARHTGNATYSDWADKVFAWSTTAGFVDAKYNVYDGASVTNNCSSINHVQFSLNAGLYLSGAAHLYNISGDAKWKTALDGLLSNTLSVFFNDASILTEISCESTNKCTTDMEAYKGLLAQDLVRTVQMAPYTENQIIPKLTTSARAAAKSCIGGMSGSVCPVSWSGTEVASSATGGVGEQLSALSVIQGLLVDELKTNTTGAGAGTSQTTSASGTQTTSSTTTTSAAGSASTSATPKSGATLAASTSTGIFLGVLASVAWVVL